MLREHITSFLSRDKTINGNRSFYLKSGSEEYYIRRPMQELQGYTMLAPYLRMPKARIAHTKIGPILVVKDMQQPAANTLLSMGPEIAKDTVERFLHDVQSMWESTARPMDTASISRNWREETINTLLKLQKDPQMQSLAHKQMIVNSEQYPCLGDTLQTCFDRLTHVSEETMVLCHGDEHLGNILTDTDSYWAIDPGNYTGYNAASSTLNNLIGGLYLFDYEYSGEIQEDDETIRVDYAIDSSFDEAERLIHPVIQQFAHDMRSVVGETLSKELLFVNELRVARGWTKRSMDLTKVLQTGMVYAGIATQHYYSDEFAL